MNILRKTGLLLLLLSTTALSCTKVVTEQVIVKETETIRDTLVVTPPASSLPSWATNSVRVGIIGDSISTFDGWIPDGYRRYYPFTGSAGSLTAVEQTWWHRLIYKLMPDAVLDRNISYSGTRVTKNTVPNPEKPDLDEYDFVTRCCGFDDPDIIIISGGTNDRPCVGQGLVGEYDWTAPLAELDRYKFRTAYICLIRTLMEEYPDTKLVCVVNDLLLTDAHKAIGESITEIAEHYELPCARITETLETVGDGVHPNSTGAARWADVVWETMVSAGIENYRKPRAGALVVGSDVLRELSSNEIRGSVETGVQTKTALNGNMKVTWNRDDRIRLFSADEPEGIEHWISELSEDGGTAIFAAEDTVAGSPRYAVYPASAVKSFAVSGGVATATIELSEAYSGGLFSDLERYGVISSGIQVAGLPMVARSDGSLFTFRNLFGAVVVRPYDYQRNKIKVKSIRLTSKDAKAISGEALVNLETATIASFSGSASATRTLDEAVAIDSYGWTSWSSHSISAFDAHSRGFVFCIPATDYPGGFTVSLIDEKGLVYSYDCGPVSVSGGEIAFLDYRPLTVYYGNANSVIVKPGDTSVTFDATPYCSFDRRFTRNNSVVGGAAALVTSADVLWQQEYGCELTDLSATAGRGTVVPTGAELAVSRDGDRLLLTVPLTGTAGNAVVALRNASGEILWSFHVWVGETADVECSTSIGNFRIMDRNLGATSSEDKSQCGEEAVRNSFGLFYQWGRKDPFPRAVNVNKRVQTSDFAMPLSVVRADNVIGSIGWSVSHPMARQYVLGSGCNWLQSYVNELWGSSYAGTVIDNIVSESLRIPGVKTAYDPCPAGYRVPDASHLNALSELNNGKLPGSTRDQYYGYHFNTGVTTNYFPATGYVNSAKADAGSLTNEGYWGMYWSSCASGQNSSAMYAQAGGSVAMTTGGTGIRGNLMSVRCLKE